MQALQDKLRVIYLPFLLIALGCVAGYSFLNWLLLIKAELFVLDVEVVNFWLPYGLPWIPILLWLRPRLKSLRLTGRKGNLPFVFHMVAALAIIAPTIVSQNYLATATGDKTALQRISQINQRPKTKYYTVRDVSFDKASTSVETRITYGGRYNEYLNIAVHLICPLDDSEDTRAPTCNLWLATVYRKRTTSRLTDNERKPRIGDFIKASWANYDRADLRTFTYLEKVGASDAVEAAVRRNSRFRPGNSGTVLQAHREDFETRNGSKLAWIFGSFGIGASIWLLMLMAAPVDQAEMNRLRRGEKPNNDGRLDAFTFFIPNRRLFVTPLLIDLCILIFLGMVFAGWGVVSFNSSDLLAVGGNFRPAVLDGEVWRLVTSQFLHGGLMHLVGNVLGLLLVGVLLEPTIGPGRFAVCYLATGVGGSIASILWHKATVSVGASGAIFGLWGALLGLSLIKKAKAPMGRKEVFTAAFFMLGYSLLIGLASGGGIDNACHVGGLLCGILLGALGGVWRWPAKRRSPPVSTP